MRVVLIVTMLVACGRIGFDARDGGKGQGDDESDSGSGSSACNPTACTSAGGSCVMDVCVIDVMGTGAITCPPGHECEINCNVNNSCTNGVDCSMATGCVIDCNASGTCGNGFSCAGTCTTYCRTGNTCNNIAHVCSQPSSCFVECCTPNSLICNGLSGATVHSGVSCPPDV